MSFRHPALHVLLLGALVAAAILVVEGPPTGDEERRVIVTGADLAHLRAAFRRTWQREPTPDELRGQLEQYVRQEVLYREALARGYDRDDQVVRQAMQRKMELLAVTQGSGEPPSEEEIAAYFALQRERYRLPAVVDLAQVYVSTEGDSEGAERKAEALLERLRDEEPALEELAGWGDPILLEPVYFDQTEKDLTGLFGAELTTAVLAAEPGIWVGPIRSAYGLHLVEILDRQDSHLPELATVRSRVLSDMEYEAARAAREQLYQEIVQSYQIVLDGTVRELMSAAGE